MKKAIGGYIKERREYFDNFFFFQMLITEAKIIMPFTLLNSNTETFVFNEFSIGVLVLALPVCIGIVIWLNLINFGIDIGSNYEIG